jgi:ADP-heptose:LPS heptosyltransferase
VIAEWMEARNVVCLRSGGVAEALMATPALRALRQQVAGRRITLLGPKPVARTAVHIPEVDEAIVQEGELGSVAVEGRSFDAAVVLTMDEGATAAAQACREAGIPLVLAGTPCDCADARHEVRRQLELVAAVGAHADDEHLSFRVRSPASWRARLKLDESGIDAKLSFIVVHPGSAQRWPHAWLGEACARLSVVLDSQIVVTGDAADRALAERVRRVAGDRARSLAGSLTLEELAAVIELAPLLLTDDADAIQLAAAVGTPVVDLDSANDLRTPWMVANRVIRNMDTAAPAANEVVEAAVAATCDLWLDIHWRAAA